MFFATTINYLDRIVFSVLIPVIRQEMHINDEAYGWLTGAFTGAYTLGFLAAGKFIDRFGTRIGYAAAIVWWSIAAALHAVARTPLQLGVWRGLLGFGEAGNFPSAIKAVAEWFPKKDRAFATGIFNAGSNVAAMLGPPLFVVMNAYWGWRSCFLITGGLGFVWVIFWFLFYRNPPVQQEGDVPEKALGWGKALTYPQTWGFALAKFLSDPVWWFYLYWLPPYLYDVRKFDLKEIGWALPVVYLMADVGSVGGGWISGWLMSRGWDTARARRAAMLLCALCMPVAALSAFATSAVASIALVSVATAAHQGWSANLFTTTSDVFPKNVVASVTGIGGCTGGFGGFLFSAIIPGFVISRFGYTPMILFMGALHLTAWFALNHLIWRKQAVAAQGA